MKKSFWEHLKLLLYGSDEEREYVIRKIKRDQIYWEDYNYGDCGGDHCPACMRGWYEKRSNLDSCRILLDIANYRSPLASMKGDLSFYSRCEIRNRMTKIQNYILDHEKRDTCNNRKTVRELTKDKTSYFSWLPSEIVGMITRY